MYLLSNNADGMELKINNALAAKHSVCSHMFVIAVNAREIFRSS